MNTVFSGFPETITKRRFQFKPTLARILNYLGLILLALIVGFPFYWMLLLSFRPETQIYSWPIEFLPVAPTLENYTALFSRPDLQIPRWFLNSVFISTTETILALIVCSMAAYAFARLKFRGRNIIFFSLLLALMIPTQVTLIPTFILVRNLGWLDSYQGVILPGVANVTAVFLLRQFFLAIPEELEEAAIIDGASRFRIYWQIILPNAKGGLVAMTIILFLGSWNNLLWPLIVLNRLEMRTLTVGLTVLQGSYSVNQMGLVMAGAAIASVPILIFYTVFQRHILKGVMTSGLKG